MLTNLNPPTLPLVLIGLGQACLLRLLKPVLAAIMRARAAQAAVYFFGSRLMTIYLWHLPVIIVLSGLAILIPGASPEPASAAWWWTRIPAYLLVLGVVFLLSLAIGRWEHPRPLAVVPPGRAVVLAAIITFLPPLAVTIWGLDIWIALAGSILYSTALLLIRWPQLSAEASATASALTEEAPLSTPGPRHHQRRGDGRRTGRRLMRGVVQYGVRDIRVEDRPEPRILTPGDAVVRVVAACVCGSDLWGYRGLRDPGPPRPVGHELVGIVEQVGDAVTVVKPGDFVISPFSFSDGTCQACRHGMTSACDHVAYFGSNDPDGLPVDGAQGERTRIPMAESTLVPVPGPVDDALIPGLLTLSDVMSTGSPRRGVGGVGTGYDGRRSRGRRGRPVRGARGRAPGRPADHRDEPSRRPAAARPRVRRDRHRRGAR